MSSIQFSTKCEVGYFVRPRGYFYPIGLGLGAPLVNIAPLNTGGTITADGSGMVHNFTSSGTFTAGFTGGVELLVVAGGGGGGSNDGSGGGAGGLRYCSSFPVTNSSPYTVTVGAGGTGSPSGSTKGANSCFAGFATEGGGFGGGPGSLAASPGGSGGGMTINYPGLGLGITGQGNPGGQGFQPNGGGGGAGGTAPTAPISPGTHPSGEVGQGGGPGCTFSISGSSLGYAGGGGGSSRGRVGGGIATDGGGCGDQWGLPTSPAPGASSAGIANRGGGGGAGNGNTPAIAQPGGSGVVIVRYTALQAVGTSLYSIN